VLRRSGPRSARRTALIFLCGFLLYWFPFFTVDAAGHWLPKPLAETRILGVLQRIALCYGMRRR
jgi:predicted acyltransferase